MENALRTHFGMFAKHKILSIDKLNNKENRLI
jgi:hypothetical protein